MARFETEQRRAEREFQDCQVLLAMEEQLLAAVQRKRDAKRKQKEENLGLQAEAKNAK